MVGRTPKPKPLKIIKQPGQKSDSELIAEALAAGRVKKLPPGEAAGALKWFVEGRK